MNEAIRISIEKGGYEPQFPQIQYQRLYTDPLGDKSVPINCMMEDPLFWTALGQALGWWDNYSGGLNTNEFPAEKEFLDWNKSTGYKQEWLFHALRYHELVLTGGDTEKFWKELTSQS